jgi:hypothetical protein
MLSQFNPSEKPGRQSIFFEGKGVETTLEGVSYEYHDVKNNIGEKVGEIRVDYYKNPFPFYYLTNFYSSKKIKDKKDGEMGYGQSIVSCFEEYVKSKKGLAVLYDDTPNQNKYDYNAYRGKPVQNIYGNQGWDFVDSFDNPISKSQLQLKHGGLRFKDLRIENSNLTTEEAVGLIDLFDNKK